MKAYCASGTAMSFCTRPCSDLPATASNEQPAFACAHARTRHRELSLGRWRSTLTCGARAPRRAGWSRPVSFGSPMRERDGPLLRCTAALRRASHGLQRAAGVRVCAHENAPPRALPREVAQHARIAALVGVDSCSMKIHCASETVLSLGARPHRDVPATPSNEQPVFACAHTRTRREVTQHALAARARLAAPDDVGACPTKAHYATGTARFLDAKT